MDSQAREPVAVTLLSLRTADGWDLDALLAEADELAVRPIADRVALLYLHGKGHSMLSTMSRFLAPRLREFSHFSLNMRSRDLAYLTGRELGPAVAGGMHESNQVGHLDVAAAISWLRSRGHRTVVLVGHSSGGWYAGDYGHHGVVDARILLSPLTDNRTATRWWFPEGAGLDAARDEALRLVAAGRDDQLILVSGWYWAISAASLLERLADTEDHWIDGVNASDSPVLLVWGTIEDRAPLWSSLAGMITAPLVSELPLQGSEHYFVGYEDELAEGISTFLAEALPGSAAPRRTAVRAAEPGEDTR